MRRRRRKGGARPPLPQCWRGCGSSSFPRRGLQLLPQRKGGARPPLPRYRRGFGSSSSSLARPAPSPPARRRSYPCSFSPAQSQPDLRVAARSVLRAAAGPLPCRSGRGGGGPDLSLSVCVRAPHSFSPVVVAASDSGGGQGGGSTVCLVVAAGWWRAAAATRWGPWCAPRGLFLF